jgi:K(+)-stimulated pyrophosphate-energized sodium pump
MDILGKAMTLVLAAAVQAAPAGSGSRISTTVIPWSWWVTLVASAVALVTAYTFYSRMLAAPEGNEKMIAIAGHVRDGAGAYLFGQYRTVATVFLIIFSVLAVLAHLQLQNPFVPVAFLTSGFLSAFCGFLGMKTATRASSRTAYSATQSLNSALRSSKQKLNSA